jgi:hypothetical protein
MSTTVTPWELYKPEGGLVVSEANDYRSRGWGKVAKGAGKLLAGTLMSGTNTLVPVIATAEATANAILLYSIDATNVDVEVAVLKRDCEVNLAYLIFDGLNTSTALTALNSQGIIVRDAVLAAPGATFAGGGRAADPGLANSPYGPPGNAGIGAGFMAVDPEAEAAASPPNAPSQPASRTDQPPPAPRS